MGRKKLGNVLFAKRVPKDKIPALLDALKAGRVSGDTTGGQMGYNSKETAKVDDLGLSRDSEIKRLEGINTRLADNEAKLEAENARLQEKIDSLVAGVTDEVMVKLKAENRELAAKIRDYEQTYG